MKVVLERYHGLGNDYVVFDPNKNELELNERNVRRICDRNAGLGSDGVLEGPILKEDGIQTEANPRRVEMVSVFLQNISKMQVMYRKRILNYIQETDRLK